MHLNKLFMRNFKKYRRAEVDFQDGLTGIVGSNGSGKSTIVEAIAWALYGNRASTIKRDFIRNIRAGDSDQVEVKLSLSMGRQELEIFRAMKGKSLMPEAFLLLDGQRIAAGTKEVDLRLEDILKISYLDFMKTFYARQKDLDNLLKEGGTGKREYLLKLLGLDDIKEKAVEQIKTDRSLLEEQKNRLAGALAEIGDVDGNLGDVEKSISSAQADLVKAESAESELSDAREKRKLELAIQSEKAHTHDFLVENETRLESSCLDKRDIIRIEEKRLDEIESSKRLLKEIEPRLERLGTVRARLELLEPKRREYEEISRQMAGARASLEGVQKALQENEDRLSLLHRDVAALEEIAPGEREHGEVQARLLSLESLRDKHSDLQARLKEESVRLNAAESNIARIESIIKDLLKARSRLEEILPQRDEYGKLQREMAELGIQRERQKEKDDLSSRHDALEVRRNRLEKEATKARRELASLGNLDDLEAKLRNQDRDLDSLGTELNNGLAELRGGLKVQELAKLDALRNLSKVKALGAEGVCPTCERPLEGQSDLLIRKYELEVSLAEKDIADLQAKVQNQKDKIDGVTKSRSGLKKAFDELNAKKSRRSELQAGLRSLEVQISETMSELSDIVQRIEALGDVLFDLQRISEIETDLKRLAPLAEECSSLVVRLEDLPHEEKEKDALQKERESLAGKCALFAEQIRALGYDESDYADARRRFAELKPMHDRFVFLSQKVLEIPGLEEKVAQQLSELKRLSGSLQELRMGLKSLGFDPSEYESLLLERRTLSKAEEDAQKIRLRLAAEPEIRRRLQDAIEALAALEKEIACAKKELIDLGYSSKTHEKAVLAMAEAEKDLERVRKEVSDRRVRLGILKGELSRLMEESQRKKEHEKSLSKLGRRLEVVDTTRGLVNRFMDQVLIRVKNDIAKTAGEILEEVSGKYSILKIDDDFNILIEDGGEFYPISRYSGGEIDMIAVSVRVAISEYLMRFGPEGESYSFLILDEIFGSQDMEHREKMIQMLRSLEERFPQIITISHISDVQGQFDNTLLVVEDEMGNSRVEAS
jgi:exonuclease SbcC